MTCILIGSGIVGLSIAKSLIEKKVFRANQILILDKYSVPSNGTSTHNSGVLHAGLYYEPNSLKAKLSRKGSEKLKDWCKQNDLPLLECGKLLIPFNNKDIERLEKIYEKAKLNNCSVEIVDFDFAKHIQKGISKQKKYLWSPLTSVFNPKLIIDKLYRDLKNQGVKFAIENVIKDDQDKRKLITKSGNEFSYSRYVNCAGPGALDLVKTVSREYDNFAIMPFLGQYGLQKSGLQINTNLYPVPDPNLPFLGIHLTPRIKNSVLIGPNAIPSIKRDIQGFDNYDLKNIPSTLVNSIIMFVQNKQNFRNNAISEFCINTNKKFENRSMKFLDESFRKNFRVEMDKTTYGIRPQIIDLKNLSFENDFIYEKINKNIHIVNAVSPAFTSCFALADFIVEKLD